MSKVLISVLSSEEGVYKDLENGIRETWLKDKEDTEVIFYYANKRTFISGDKLYLDTGEEKYEDIGRKTLKMFEYVLQHYHFDYLFRTNSSSYVNIKKINEYIKDKPKNNFYNAIIGQHNNINFASGSGYFISRDLIEKVIANKNIWNHNYIDDVALAELLSKIGVFPSWDYRYDYNENNMNDITKEIINKHYHFRCKCKNRNNDVVIFNKIHQLLH